MIQTMVNHQCHQCRLLNRGCNGPNELWKKFKSYLPDSEEIMTGTYYQNNWYRLHSTTVE